MQKSAYFRITGVTPPKVDRAVSTIIHASPKYNVAVISSPKAEKVRWPKRRARFSGCEEIELKRKVIHVRGEVSNLKKMLRLKTHDVYVQLEI